LLAIGFLLEYLANAVQVDPDVEQCLDPQRSVLIRHLSQGYEISVGEQTLTGT
jgi:hypothetical protein